MTEGPPYCSTCGASLTPGDNFCAQCGSSVDGGGRGHALGDGQRRTDPDRQGTARAGRNPSDEDRAWLRQRVADLRIEGWEKRRDAGDRVVLVDRSVGSIPAHLVLLFLTAGLGNVLYAWYRWTVGAPEREVHADGTERVRNDSSLGGILAGLAIAGVTFVTLTFAALMLLLSLEPLAVVFGLFALTTVAVGVGWSIDPDGESLSTFGRERTVETESVRTPPESCTSCGSRVIDGTRREYADRLYLAGLPVKTFAEGSNTYCATCATDQRDVETASEIDEELDRMRERSVER